MILRDSDDAKHCRAGFPNLHGVPQSIKVRYENDCVCNKYPDIIEHWKTMYLTYSTDKNVAVVKTKQRIN